MALKLEISGNTFEGFQTAVSVAHGSDAEIKFTDNNLKNCINGIVERDKTSFLDGLGLPQDTPVDAVLEVIQALRVDPAAGEEKRLATVKASRAWAYVERSSNAITVVQGLVALAASGIGIPNLF
ncbi:hypothetical protein [Pseudomonas sp. S2_F03]